MTFGASSLIDEKHARMAEILPHGNGINADWNCRETKQYIYFTNAYQVMNDAGFYIGWQDFSVRFNRSIYNAWLNATQKLERCKYEPTRLIYLSRVRVLLDLLSETFTLQFNNGHYLADRYYMGDYLFDDIGHALTQAMEDYV